MKFNIVDALKFNLEPKCRCCAVNKIKLDSRVLFVADVAWLPHATIRCGELGTVVALQEDYGGLWQLEVLLDNFHPGLVPWRNEVLIIDPELTSVALYIQQKYTCPSCTV